MEVLEITAADDFHHHLRDVPVLRDVLVHAQRNFGRIVTAPPSPHRLVCLIPPLSQLVMPNTVPPVRNVDDACAYRDV
jgi:dihydroorotase